jgi:gliding motility-associated-like protein
MTTQPLVKCLKRAIIAVAILFSSKFLAQSPPTFPCDNGLRLYFFQSVGANGSIAYVSNYTATPVVTTMFQMNTSQHNALAANSIDNYLYFQQGTNLMRLDAVGGTTAVCNLGFSSAYGCFDHLGRYWTMNGSNLVAFNITSCAQVKGPYNIPSSGGFIDIVYNIFDNHFYTETCKIDTNGVIQSSSITTFTPSSTWGGVAMGANGLIYGIAGSAAGGTLAAINLSSNTSFTVMNVNPGPTAGSSDAASFMCSANTTTSVCMGSALTVSIGNPYSLANPSYSIQPGATVQSTPVFTVNPSASTNYSLYVTGTNSVSQVVTYSVIATVSINPVPIISPTVINGTCSNPSTSSVNLNITWNPPGSPNYTTTWSPMPGTVTTVNSPTASGLVPGTNNVTVTTSAGCTAAVSFSVPPIPLPASFTIVNPSNDYTITCINTNIVLTTSITNGVPLTFTWLPSCTSSVTGTNLNLNQSCTGQVIGTSSTGCQMVQTFTVYQDLTSPTIVITPTINNITCAGGSGCFTLTSNLGPNVTTNWFQIIGTSSVYVGAAQGTVNIFCAGAPGVYWGESVYNITGCRSTKSVQVTASVGVPQFTVTSPTNFTIGCSTKSVTSMQVSSVITSPVPNVAVNYTFMVPPVTSTPTTFTINPNLNNITIPGTYVVYIKDLTNNCISSQSISIIQNTIAPNVNYVQPLPQLTCRDFSMVLNGISSNTNTQITWTVPAFPGSSVNPTPNATVITIPSITGATNNVVAIGVWTVGAVDQNNFCSSSKTVQINQDIRSPKFTITALTNSVINCKNSDVVIVPVVTPTLAAALVPTYLWFSPVNPVGFPGTQFNTTAAGTHTAISTSVVNGCTTSATYIVASDFAAPAIGAAPEFTLDCASNPTAQLVPNITGTTTGFTYSWTVPPGALTSALTGSNLTTNLTGNYFVTVTNTLNGCVNQGDYTVIGGTISANFVPIPGYGFVPMTVSFQNLSTTSTGASSIISTWGYGNGVVTSTIINSTVSAATYTASGTYSVILRVQKGLCIDTAIRIVIAELPSKLEVPNIFTPNGDKVNDVFRLRATNLKEVYLVVYDRWGNKVYEVTSDTGNFAWDGKNQLGKECSDGVYFYVIKATGEDEKEYEMKGNVSLYR